MKKSFKYFSLYFIPLLFVSCSDYLYNEKIIDDYYLVAFDSSPSIGLYTKIDNDSYTEQINGNITSIGWNDSYIVLQSNNVLDRKIHYYILCIESNRISYRNGIFDFTDVSEFNNKKRELGLEKLAFTMFPKY